MDQQNNFVFSFDSISQPQRRAFADTDDVSSPLRSRRDVFWGGQPMEVTNSNGSTNSNMSQESYSSAATVSSPTTTYGSYGTSSYVTGYNEISSIPVEGLYSTDRIDNNCQQGYLKTEAPELEKSSSTLVHTPRTLGWTPNTKLHKLYICVVPKNKKAPYLELKSCFNPNDMTPSYVHLDEPTNYPKGQYPCMYPGCEIGNQGCEKKKEKKKGSKRSRERETDSDDEELQRPKGPPPVFSRPADLERHYIARHSKNKPEFPCDVHRCVRGTKKPFNRKDHYRDHLRDYHRQDLGSAKREKRKNNDMSEEEIEANWKRNQQAWIESRLINPWSWRCNKCLMKTKVATHGWTCQNQKCNHPCEEDRIQARQRLSPEVVRCEEPLAGMMQPDEDLPWEGDDMSDYYYPCGNSGSVYGEATQDWGSFAHCGVPDGLSLEDGNGVDEKMEEF